MQSAHTEARLRSRNRLYNRLSGTAQQPGALTGTYERDPSCSCGAKATWLGGKPDNDLTWDDVTVPRTGRYRIAVSVLTPETRLFTADINGRETVNFSVAHNGTVTAIVELNQGRNTVRLHNDTALMPDIDCMTVDPE